MAIIKPNNNTISAITALPSGMTSAPGLSVSGTILQIVSSSDTTERSTSSTSFGGNPAGMLSVDITPASTSSKILLSYYGNGYINADAGSMFFTIYRDSSDLGNSNKGLTNIRNDDDSNTVVVPTSITTFDEPNTTSQVTYTLTIRAGSGTAYVNYNSSRSRLTAFGVSLMADAEIMIYKNGSSVVKGRHNASNNYQYWMTPTVQGVVQLGTTDYVEIYAKGDVTTSTPIYFYQSQHSWFGGYKIID